MTVMDAKHTLPNLRPAAVHRVEWQGGGAAQRWYVVWLHIRATSGLTEQKADEAELNNYYSSINPPQHLTFYHFL